jgi:hypothetical protein
MAAVAPTEPGTAHYGTERARHHMSDRQPGLTEDMLFLAKMAADVIEASRVAPGQAVGGEGPNSTGQTLIRPGGRDCYPGFWIRDFTMSLACGLVPRDEIEHAVRLTAGGQASADWHTKSGSFVPRGSIADHITLDGKPIYFPGSFCYEEQGQPWGYFPSLDDHFYFVEMAWHLMKDGENVGILTEEIDGVPLIQRLELAFAVPPVQKDGDELVWCVEDKRGVGFGFCDSIVHTGHLLFCSVLKARAARQLAGMMELCGDEPSAARYRALAQTIAEQLAPTFADDSGLLRASTGRSAQPDVWGSAFAVYSGLLKDTDREQVCRALHRGVLDGSIAWRGNIRHVPTSHDFSKTTAWEKMVNSAFTRNRYQNGAYWNTPTGWVCYAVAEVDESVAQELSREYVAELRAGDFRQGEAFGSPFECIHPEEEYRQNAVYLTSVTCPLAAFNKLGWVPGDR